MPASLGQTFKDLVDEYLRNALKKGVPPLFTNLRSLYADKEKVTLLLKSLFLSLLYFIAHYNCISGSALKADSHEEG